MSTRTRLGLTGLLFVLGLATLALLAPPDGQERGELGQFFGSLHPLAVHLPIALLLLVPLLEFAGLHPQRRQLRASAAFILGLAVLSALAAPYLGWLLARSGGFAGEFVTQHMWGGIGVAAAALLCWVLRGSRPEQPEAPLPATYSGMLGITVLLVAFTGYRGGQLAHGEDHLTEHLSSSLQAWVGISPNQQSAAHAQGTFFGARVAPIFDDHCVVCHGANKRKGGLRLDRYAGLITGGKHGAVVKAGDSQGSDLVRRIALPSGHKDFMPAEGKPPVSEDDRKLIAMWIDAGASETIGIDAIAGAPAFKGPAEPLAPDYQADQQLIAQLETSLRVRLLPRSQNPNDGLVLRTASLPAACDDAALAKLAPVARYIVDAELARTKVTDAGLKSLASFSNLRTLDLSHTVVTSSGAQELSKLPKLETLNLTATAVDDAGAETLRASGTIRDLYLFQTKVKL